VSANNNVLYLEYLDRVLDNAQHIEVCMDHEIGDIPVNKELSGLNTGDFLCRYPAIGAANPEKLRLLSG
jgi:hypothetical protein